MITEQTATIQLDIVYELIAHFEVEIGRKPTDREVQIAYRAYELGRKMADRGYNDKKNGRDPLPISAIDDVTKFVITGTSKEDVGFANHVAKLLHENYMIGFNGEKEVVDSE